MALVNRFRQVTDDAKCSQMRIHLKRVFSKNVFWKAQGQISILRQSFSATKSAQMIEWVHWFYFSTL
jgi:hypothetical protein